MAQLSFAGKLLATPVRPLRRVLMVCTNLHAQGAETHAVHFSAACRAQGLDCVIAAQADGPIARLAGQHGVPVLPLRIIAAADLPGLIKLWRILRAGKFDVVLASDAREFLPVVLAARLAGADSFLFRHVNQPLKRAEVWSYSRWASGFFPVSDYTRQVLLRSGVPAGLAAVLYNPASVVPAAQCASWRTQTRAALALPAEGPLLGFAGAMLEYKGVFLLAEAVNRAMLLVPDLHMVWIGPEAQHRQVLAAVAEPLRSRHRWLGWQDDPRPYYAAMDLLAMPSLCAEAFGRVSIEAQACGTPVLANRRAGGLAETLQDGITGELLAAEPEAWAAAIARWTRQADARPELPSRAWVEAEFGPAAVVSRFRQLVANARAARSARAAAVAGALR